MAASQPRINRAAWVTKELGPVEVRDAPIHELGKGEVLIRVQAAAMTPMDGKMFSSAIIKLNYPTVFSSNVAGFVDAIGEGVTRVKVGDRVVSGTNIWPSKGDPKFGGMQRFTIVEEYEVMEIGELDFGIAIASSIQTACAALFSHTTLNLDRPTNPQNPTPKGKKILIWGGASAMGVLAVCHAANAGYTVITTCSPNNFELLKERGAAHIFDYNDPNTINKIRDLFPIDYVYDCVSLPESVAAVVDVLSPPGKPIVNMAVQILMPVSMLGNPILPDGITLKPLFFRNQAEENKEFMEWMVGNDGYLKKGMKEGWVRGARPESIGGLDNVAQALERRAKPGLKGVSGARLIVEPWK